MIEVVGDEPPHAGMVISMLVRRDLVVTDPELLMASARRVYRELHPGTSEAEAAELVTCAADAAFTLFERDPELHVDEAVDGVAPGGWNAEVRTNAEHPLKDATCFDYPKFD